MAEFWGHNRFLLPPERVVRVARSSLGSLLLRMKFSLPLLAAGIGVSLGAGDRRIRILAVSVAVLCALGALVTATRWSRTTYVVTNVRLMRFSGVFVRQVHSLALDKVTDLAFRQSMPGHLMRVATIDIRSANELSPLKEVRDLRDPEAFYAVLMSLVGRRLGYTDTDVTWASPGADVSVPTESVVAPGTIDLTLPGPPPPTVAVPRWDDTLPGA